MLRYLVEKGVDLNSVVSGERCTPLQHAAEKGNRRIIDLLLELGADIDGPEGKDGFTIHYALMSGNESIVRHVLDKGAVISDSNTTWGSIVDMNTNLQISPQSVTTCETKTVFVKNVRHAGVIENERREKYFGREKHAEVERVVLIPPQLRYVF